MISNAKASSRHTQYKDELSTVGDRQPNKIILFMLSFITLSTIRYPLNYRGFGYNLLPKALSDSFRRPALSKDLSMVLSIFITLIIAAFFSIITIFLLTQLPDPINFMSLQGLSIIFLGFLLACIATAIANYKLFLTKHGHIEPKRKGLKAEGVVKWFNINKGYGFITQENGEDIFVHYRSIQGHGRKKLMEGQRVSYRVVDSDRGLQADDVEVLD